MLTFFVLYFLVDDMEVSSAYCVGSAGEFVLLQQQANHRGRRLPAR
ncbi:hypothetical protein [Kribbella yunnanensis]